MSLLEVPTTSKIQVQWLHAGAPQVGLAICGDCVAVEGEDLHGHVHAYDNTALGLQCLILVFCGPRHSVEQFEKQIAHHMKLVADSVYRNQNNNQILVCRNIHQPVLKRKTHTPECADDRVSTAWAVSCTVIRDEKKPIFT